MAELKKGSKGKEVEDLQKLLNKAGAKPPLKVDGSFGPVTEGQVKAFQKKAKLSGDGRVGDTTMAAVKYGGPLPEMSVKDYKPRLDAFKKSQEVNAGAYKKYAALEKYTMQMSDAMKSKLPDANKALHFVTKSVDEVIVSAQKIVEMQAGFEKLRRKDPDQAAFHVDECEDLDMEITQAGSRDIVPQIKRLEESFDEIGSLLKTLTQNIQYELDEIKKRAKEFRAML